MIAVTATIAKEWFPRDYKALQRLLKVFSSDRSDRSDHMETGLYRLRRGFQEMEQLSNNQWFFQKIDLFHGPELDSRTFASLMRL